MESYRVLCQPHDTVLSSPNDFEPLSRNDNQSTPVQTLLTNSRNRYSVTTLSRPSLGWLRQSYYESSTGVFYIVVMGEVVEATWFRLQLCMDLALENSSSAQCALRTGGNFSKFNDITKSSFSLLFPFQISSY